MFEVAWEVELSWVSSNRRFVAVSCEDVKLRALDLAGRRPSLLLADTKLKLRARMTSKIVLCDYLSTREMLKLDWCGVADAMYRSSGGINKYSDKLA